MPPVLLMDFTNVGNGIHTLKLQEGRISRRPSWSSVFSYNKLIDWRLEWQHLHSANIAIPGQRWWQSEGKRKNRSSSAFYCCVYCHLDSAIYFGIFVWFLDSHALVPCPHDIAVHTVMAEYNIYNFTADAVYTRAVWSKFALVIVLILPRF